MIVAATSAGLAEALRRAGSDDAVWFGSDVTSEAEHARLKPNLSFERTPDGAA